MRQGDPDTVNDVMAFQRQAVAHEPVTVALDRIGRCDLGEAFDRFGLADIPGMKDACRLFCLDSAQQCRLDLLCAISHMGISKNYDALVC